MRHEETCTTIVKTMHHAAIKASYLGSAISDLQAGVNIAGR